MAEQFEVSVKNSPHEGAHFRLEIRVDSGTEMLIGRVKESLKDYVLVRKDIAPTKEELAALESLTDVDRGLVILQIRMELARRNVGHSGIGGALGEFYIFKRIPINENLTEHEFMAAIDEVEAATHAITIVYLIGIQRGEKRQVSNAITLPQ